MPAFRSGTKKFFKQTSAPSGWTKETTNTDYTLRIVNGSTGGTLTGTNGFVTTFASKALSGVVDSVSGTVDSNYVDVPSHNHSVTFYYPTTSGSYQANSSSTALLSSGGIGSTGGITTPGAGGLHGHTLTSTGSFTGTTINFGVKYVDFILATKS